MAELQKNQLHTVTVSGYSGEGMGVARIDGRVVFIAGALRGEVCEIQILKVLKSVAYARVKRLLSPSPQRQESDCTAFPRCGGCAFRHMTYEEELALKRERVEDALARIGGSNVVVEEILGAEDTRRYRNKAQFAVGSGGTIGFYRARTHEVITCETCLLVHREAEDAMRAVKIYLDKYSVAPYDEATGKGLLRHLYVRSNRVGECLICLVVNGKKLPYEEDLSALLREACPSCVGIVLAINTKRGNVILGEAYRTLWGENHLEDTLCDLTFRLSVPSFYQINRDQAEKLYQKAIDFAAFMGSETVLDLYCGVGTITLAMAKHCKRVIGAEIVPQAIEDAKDNAVRNGIENAEFFCGDASAIAKKLASEHLRPNVITVDPPRKGLAQDVVESIVSMSPDRVVYVSCDPATLARDVRRFADLGYDAVRAAAVDMFPRADHVETVVLMSRVKE